MNDYTAWLNGQSVARGTISQVETRAKAIAETENFREFGFIDGRATLKITRGARQLFVKSIILERV